jgi:outer membrane protein assembly factor BamD (BamD/ComL family)
MKGKLWLVFLIPLFIWLAGCSSDETREFTAHEPGLYKGGKDPLLDKNMDQELKKRFMQVQTDR